MTTLVQSSKLKLLLSLYLLYFSGYSLAFEEKEETTENLQFHTIQFNSEQPSSTCAPLPKESEEGTYLKLVHRHGPCSPFYQKGRGNAPSIFITLKRAKSRKPKSGFVSLRSENDYVITVGVGTPKQEVSFSFDTGSYLTWTQCKSPSGHYFRQKHPLFDPSKSKTFNSSLQCIPPTCPGKASKCRCPYYTSYGDGSITAGYYTQDRFVLTTSDVLHNFLFGCAENTTGLFHDFEDGILGLGMNPLSIVQQTAMKYHQIFSYCIPDKGDVGFLRFGGRAKESLVYIPIKRFMNQSTFYGIDLIGATVGGKRVPIPSSVFSKAGAIIDSGTTVTRFPFEIYKPIRDTYRKAMSWYKLVDAKQVLGSDSLFDTCHSIGHQKSFKVPKVSFLFRGGVAVDIPPSGIAQQFNSTILCFVISGKTPSSDSPSIIWGHAQHQTIEVVHDVGQGRIGFGHGACK